jgi:MoxR-like ATPase
MAGSSSEPRASRVLGLEDVLAARDVVRAIFVDDKVKRYVVDVVGATRDPAAAGMADLANLIENGASVRASINLVKVAKAHAMLAGRNYISPHDVKSIAHDVLRHRVLVTYEAEAEEVTPEDVVRRILDSVEVP